MCRFATIVMSKKNDNDIEVVRHSTAHLLAHAVQELYPKTKFGVGPVIENGFYYDMEIRDHSNKPVQIGTDDLKKIEKLMKQMKSRNEKYVRREMGIEAGINLFKKMGQSYKVELLKDLKLKGTTSLKDDDIKEALGNGKGKVSVYETGDFFDLCRGPHVESTKDIKVFKLHKIAGAYWRGDEKNPMLTRIYGLAFEKEKELEDYLHMLEEAERRDHRKLGKELGLFVFSDLVGPGLPLYTAKGAIIRREIIKYSNELQSAIGYKEVHTPNINKAELFKVSGHYDKYKEDMFKVVSNYTKEEYFLKPMNCPQHTQLFASEIRSYKDLPFKVADFSNLYRDEKPGELSGITRLKYFSQDDGHCFCREDQIEKEFLLVLKAIKLAMKTYKMDYHIRLSLWDPEKPEKYLGDPKVWKKSQKLLEDILIDNKIEYKSAEGEAAIYGPKMDLISKDSLGREWQISTIQLDFIMPERFGLKYIDKDGKDKMPVMIHRALVGSPERFLGILIEHYAGVFPTWLAPTQVQIVPVGALHKKVSNKLALELEALGLRVYVDESDETVGKKIRNAEKSKVPYMLVIGDKEKDLKKLTVRRHGDREMENMSLKKFIEMIKGEIAERKA